MKILQVITLSELGGAQSVVINLANSLHKLGHEVIIAAGEGDGKMWTIINPGIKQERCKHLKRSLSPISDLLAILEFKGLYNKHKPDIIHLHSSKAGLLGRIAFPSQKTIYTVHGFDSIRLAHKQYLPLERFMQTYCKAIVGVSKYDLKNLLAENILHNVSCVYNGINKLIISTKPSFKLPLSYKKTILCIARISPQKNLNLFKSIALLLPEYAFVWIGNQYEVKEHPQNVYFLGNIANAGIYNSIADIFILPSNYEGLPMVIIEAMSFGKPVVASNVGGISEIVKNDWNGYVLENKASLFADKIKYILENEDIYKKFSQNALERFTKDLTVDNMVYGYLKIYNN